MMQRYQQLEACFSLILMLRPWQKHWQSNQLLLVCGHLFQWENSMAWSMASHAVQRSSSWTWKSLLSLAGPKVDLFLGRFPKGPLHFWSPEGAESLKVDPEALVTLQNGNHSMYIQVVSKNLAATHLPGYLWVRLIMSLQQCHVQVLLFKLKLMLYHVVAVSESQFTTSTLWIHIWIY